MPYIYIILLFAIVAVITVLLMNYLNGIYDESKNEMEPNNLLDIQNEDFNVVINNHDTYHHGHRHHGHRHHGHRRHLYDYDYYPYSPWFYWINPYVWY